MTPARFLYVSMCDGDTPLLAVTNKRQAVSRWFWNLWNPQTDVYDGTAKPPLCKYELVEIVREVEEVKP